MADKTLLQSAMDAYENPVVNTAIGFTPILGDIQSGAEAIRSFSKGNYGEGLLNAVGLLPFIPSLGGAVKGVKGLENYFTKEAIDKLAQPAAYKSKEIYTTMSPNEFLSMAEKIDRPTASKLEEIRSRFSKGDKIDQDNLPYLIINRDPQTGAAKIVGHEGRHRAMFFNEQNLNQMPVRVLSDIRWSEQLDPTKFDYVKNWPKTLVDQQGRVLPFPFTREGTYIK